MHTVKRPPADDAWWICRNARCVPHGAGSKWDAEGRMGMAPAGYYGDPPHCPRCKSLLEPPAGGRSPQEDTET